MDLIFVTALDGVLLHTNHAPAQILGWTSSDLIGGPILAFVHPEDLDRTERTLERLSETGVVSAHLVRLRARSGTYQTFEWTVFVRESGSQAVWVARSQTEQRLLERQLRDSEQRFADIVSASGDYVFELDRRCCYTFMTDRVEALLGRPVDDYIGRAPWEFVSVESADEVRRVLGRAVREGSRIRDLEFEVERADGANAWHAVHTVPMFDHLGRIRGLRGVGHDITERRAAAAALEVAKESAEEASRSKSDFLANMSHELRTPMTAILGFADLLKDDQLNREERERHIATIGRNGEHLLRLVNDILDLSKIEAGRLELDARPCRVRELVEEVGRLLSVRAEGKGLDLEVSVADVVPACVVVDSVRLRQVLVNLVGNAIKFTECGGVRVTVTASPVDQATVDLRIAVEDSGIGINEAHLCTLFHPFKQADSSMTRRFGGTGLGLSISDRLVRLMGGTIAVESEAGCGSTFTVSLACSVPVQKASAPRSPDALEPHSKVLSGRVLLVEDGPDNQLLVGHFLRKAGLAFEVAENGQMACERIESAKSAEPFDLVLMDMQMPVMDGYEATKALRSRGDMLPIIALTAHAMAGDRERCLDAGCDDFLTKPIDRRLLLATLSSYLRG